MKWEWNSIQKEEQFVFIAWRSRRNKPTASFHSQIPQIIAGILVSLRTEVLLSTPPYLNVK